MDTIDLDAHGVSAGLAPACGGLVRSLVWRNDGRAHDLLYAPPDAAPVPGAIARFGLWPMVPFANRAFGASMLDGDRRIPLPVNDPDKGGALHGFGWQAAWEVVDRSSDAATLVHRRTGGPDPYRYDARLTVRLGPEAVEIDLSVTNEADEALPYGIGLHPWFPRDLDTRLRLTAGRALALDSSYRPVAVADVPPDLDLSAGRILPQDREFAASLVGWTGEAEIVWPGRALALRLDASETLRHPVVWSPAGAPFLCVEPQSHAIGAPSEAVARAATPLARLPPGETLSGTLRLRPAAIREA